MSEPIPLESFYDFTQISTAFDVSPDGERLAFVTAESDQAEEKRLTSLFVVPTDGSREPHRLTRVPGGSQPKWGPDGRRLAFVAAREEDTERRVGWQERDEDEEDGETESDADDNASNGNNGDNGDEPKSQVWLFDLSLGGDARQVTEFDEGVREFDWSPDGDRLVVSARDPTEEEREYLERRRDGGPVETERLQHKADGVGYLDSVTTYLFVVDAESGDSERLDDAYGGGAFEPLTGMNPAWGPSDRIAFTSCRLDNPDDTMVRDVYAVNPDGGNLERWTDSDLAINSPTWSPDGDSLAFVGSDPENWYVPSQLFVHDGDEYESLTAELDRTLARGASPQWAGDETLYVLVGDEGKTRPVRVGTDGTVERAFEAQGDDRAVKGFDIGGDAAGFLLSHPSDGQDLFALDVADLGAESETEPASFTRLSRVNGAFTEEYEMPQVRWVTYDSDVSERRSDARETESPGGWEIEGIVYAPPEFDFENPEEHPLVVAIHGGPISYDEPEFRFTHAAFTSRGYVVFRPNYRGGSSYGRQFAETLRGRWGTVEVEDIAAGIEEMVDRGYADPERVFGHGFSYGGIAQGFLVTQTDLLTAAAPEHGLYDLRSAYGTDDSHIWTETEYGVPWEAGESLDASSSILDVGELSTPLLVMAGEEDWRCPPSQSEQLYVSAKKQGVDAKFVLYPGEHHNVGDPDRAIHRISEILDWYERHDPASE
ncbi:S9 family peptidase [Haloprofundus halophilus]|uniref:S9 family peptidase n=1 Tax=Haloprofundus halophilus TaxID=2283527 RepID=UPI000E4460B3|nr:S9 family peptidase [Haloprofundus halophilus]